MSNARQRGGKSAKKRQPRRHPDNCQTSVSMLKETLAWARGRAKSLGIENMSGYLRMLIETDRQSGAKPALKK